PTVRAITDKAGVNLGPVNFHFGSKEQFYAEAVRHAASTCCQSVPDPQWQPGTPPEQKLRDFVTTFLQRVVVDREPAWHARLIMREMSQPTPACTQFVRDFARPTFEMLSGILAQLLPAAPEAKRRLCGFSIVGQILHYRFARPVLTHLIGAEAFRALDVAVLAEHITEFSLAALERLAARPRKRG